MDRQAFTTKIVWGRAYNAAWDNSPLEYSDAGLVGWGRSRRLGKLNLPPDFKAYIGVQHVDPTVPGWAAIGDPTARFFVSWFAGRRCLGLRTAPTLPAALDILWASWLHYERATR